MGISWNRRNPCPYCSGFAGAYKDSLRCRGFEHRDGEGFFCEQPRGGKAYNFSGYDLWFYRFDEIEQGDGPLFLL